MKTSYLFGFATAIFIMLITLIFGTKIALITSAIIIGVEGIVLFFKCEYHLFLLSKLGLYMRQKPGSVAVRTRNGKATVITQLNGFFLQPSDKVIFMPLEAIPIDMVINKLTTSDGVPFDLTLSMYVSLSEDPESILAILATKEQSQSMKEYIMASEAFSTTRESIITKFRGIDGRIELRRVGNFIQEMLSTEAIQLPKGFTLQSIIAKGCDL